MANTLGSNNPFPSVLFAEHVDPANPGAGTQRLFVDTDHLLKLRDSSGTVTTFTGGAGLTDPMTTRGDLIYRNASNVSDRLAIGSSGKVLSSNGTDVSWQTPTAGFSPTESHLYLAANVTLTPANTFVDVVSLSLAAGTYLLIAVFESRSAAAGYITGRLTDGTNIEASDSWFDNVVSANTLTLTGFVTVGSTTTWKLQAAATANNSTVFTTSAANGAANKATVIRAVRLF